MNGDPKLEIFNYKFTGWKATAIVLAVWMTPFFIGYLLGILR